MLFYEFCSKIIEKIIEKYLVGFIKEKLGRNREKNKENARNYGKIDFNTYLNKYDD